MRIAYHLGVHCTDDDRLVKTLLRNAAALSEHGIEVPDPGRYRGLIRDTAVQLKGNPASPDAQALVLDQILQGAPADRMVLSWDNFLAFPNWALKGSFYKSGGERMRAIRNIFPDAQAEFHLALRNPAAWVSDLFRRQRGRDWAEFIEGTDLADLRWSDLILALQDENPDAALILWADEDTPLIWPEVLQTVSGHPDGMVLEGAGDLVESLMTADGLARMAGYLQTHPPQTILQRRRVVSAFLDKFGRPEALETPIILPGASAELVQIMGETYDRDLAYIATLPGVTMINA